jgi:hypothetical protein
MSKKSKYSTILARKSYCPRCGATLTLLARRDCLISDRLPWFYICWYCKKIHQVGVGEVREDEDAI